MSEIEQQFQKAAQDIKSLKSRPEDRELLDIYGLFKQATMGDCNQSKPSRFQMKESAKYEAWLALKGISQDEAKEKYIAKAKDLMKLHG